MLLCQHCISMLQVIRMFQEQGHKSCIRSAYGRQSNSFHSSYFFQVPNNQNTTEIFGKNELARYCSKKCSKWENQHNFFRPPKLKFKLKPIMGRNKFNYSTRIMSDRYEFSKAFIITDILRWQWFTLSWLAWLIGRTEGLSNHQQKDLLNLEYLYNI